MTNTYNMIQKNEYMCIHLTSVPSPLDLNKDPRTFPNDLTKLCLDKRVGSFFIAHTGWLG